MRRYYKFYELSSPINLDRLKKVFEEGIYMCSYLQQRESQLGFDPKEGTFLLDQPLDERLRDILRNEKQKYMIGCVSKRLHNAHLWKDFANQGAGACLSFSTTDNQNYIRFSVKYLSSLPKVTNDEFMRWPLEKQVKFALRHKRKKYSEEEEVRFIKKEEYGIDHANIPILHPILYLGWAMPQEMELKCREIAMPNDVKVIKLRKPINNVHATTRI